jgi:hypothetical protein
VDIVDGAFFEAMHQSLIEFESSEVYVKSFIVKVEPELLDGENQRKCGDNKCEEADYDGDY